MSLAEQIRAAETRREEERKTAKKTPANPPQQDLFNTRKYQPSL